MNRRSFVTSGLTALAGLAATPTPALRAAGAAKTGVDFDFTGLFTFRLGLRTKQMYVLLTEAAQAGLSVNHAALLLMPLEAYVPHPDHPFRAPNIIRFGQATLAAWWLSNTRVWVKDAHARFDDVVAGTLAFNQDPIDPSKYPNPIDDDAKWASFKWFASLEELVGQPVVTSGGGGGGLQFKPKTIASQVRLTQGYAAGMAPKLNCERKRKYQVNHGPERSFATQMHVEYEHAPGVMYLAFDDPSIQVTSYVGVHIDADKLTPVSIANTPLQHDARPNHEHYRAFYAMVGKNGLGISYKEYCDVRMQGHGQKMPAISGNYPTEPSSPDPDCIPPSSILDA
jgi:hypothetical protein